MRSLRQYILEELSASMETRVVDWYRERHPDSPFIPEFSVSATFQGIYDRLNGKTALGDGEDAVYGYVNVYKTDIANELLSELSRLTGVPEELLHDLWKRPRLENGVPETDSVIFNRREE